MRTKGSFKRRWKLLDIKNWELYSEDEAIVLRKKASKKRYYFSNIENALQDLFEQLILDRVENAENYKATPLDLANAIKETRKELSAFLERKEA